MPLGKLAQYVQNLIVPNPDGKTQRVAFNDAAFKAIGNGSAALSGDDCKAFLSFSKGEICRRAMEAMADDDPSLSNKSNVTDFWIWFWDFSRWQWPSGEEDAYGGEKPAGPLEPQYNGPECLIYRVDAKAASGPSWELDIYVQAALTGCSIAIHKHDTGEQVAQGPPTAQSGTFRYGRLQFKTDKLTPGSQYKLSVVNQVGNGINVPITAGGQFTAP